MSQTHTPPEPIVLTDRVSVATAVSTALEPRSSCIISSEQGSPSAPLVGVQRINVKSVYGDIDTPMQRALGCLENATATARSAIAAEDDVLLQMTEMERFLGLVHQAGLESTGNTYLDTLVTALELAARSHRTERYSLRELLAIKFVTRRLSTCAALREESFIECLERLEEANLDLTGGVFKGVS